MDIVRPIPNQPIPEHAKKVFSGKLFDVYQWEQELYDGRKAIFEKLKRPDSVFVFPVMDEGKILLTHQEQPGTASFIGAPGGRVDSGEDILEAAKRELLEETGYEASEFILWDSRQPFTKVDWAVYTFIAKGLKKVAQSTLDGGEKISTQEYSFEELLDIAEDDRFDAKEVVSEFLKAKIYPEKKAKLKKLFQPL